MSNTSLQCLNPDCEYIFDEDSAIRHTMPVKSEFWGTVGFTHETVYSCPKCGHDQFLDLYQCPNCDEHKATEFGLWCEKCSIAEDELYCASIAADIDDPWPELKEMISDEIEFTKERK